MEIIPATFPYSEIVSRRDDWLFSGRHGRPYQFGHNQETLYLQYDSWALLQTYRISSQMIHQESPSLTRISQQNGFKCHDHNVHTPDIKVVLLFHLYEHSKVHL